MAANKLEQNYEARAAVRRSVGEKLLAIRDELTEALSDPDLFRDGLPGDLAQTLTHASLRGPMFAPALPVEPETEA